MVTYLNDDLLKTILFFLAMSTNGATDVARVMMSCKLFMTSAKERRVLKSINWSNVKVVEGRVHLFHHINGLLSQSAEVGNETAQYVLSKAVLLGSRPLWSRMLENDMVQAYINNLINHTLEAKKVVIDILKEDARIEMPCISNVFYGNRHHAILVRLFISRCSSEDMIQISLYLQSYVQFFQGFEASIRSGFYHSITRMCAYGSTRKDEEQYVRCITEDIMDESGSTEPTSIPLRVSLEPEKAFENWRKQASVDFNYLFPLLSRLPDHLRQSSFTWIHKVAADFLEHRAIRYFEQIVQQIATMMSYLNGDLLKTILFFLAMTPNGATDVARVMTTCKIFMTTAKDVTVLKNMNWSNVRVVEGRAHLFHHINSLLSQSAELGNETAQYVLSKAILLGSRPLWSRMLENDRVQAYIYNLAGHTPKAKKEVIDILKEEAISDMPCISNVFYGNRHHTALVRLFINKCSPDDINQMCQYLQSYAQFFKGFEAVIRAEFFSSTTKMCEYGYGLNGENPVRSVPEDIMNDSGSSLSVPNSISLWDSLPLEQVFEKRREQVLYDFNILFPAPDCQPSESLI